jgi:choline dehydrogenase-like flavoprotein
VTGFDGVVVIGSGPCGAAATRSLARAGVPVTVMDVGTRVPRGVVVRVAGRTAFRWVDKRPLHGDRHVSAADDATQWWSGLALGGLSNYWTGAVPRFAPEDFTDGARLDERYDWPIRYADLVPHYDDLEPLLRITAADVIAGVPEGKVRYRCRVPADWTALARRLESQGVGIGAMPMVKGAPWMVALRGNEFVSHHALIEPILRPGRVTLRPGALALRLNHDHAADRVTSVDYLDTATRTVHSLHASAFVVAAGAVDSTALLLRSTSTEFPTGLGNAHGVLGRYLHDHPSTWVLAQLRSPMTALSHPMYIAREDHATSEPLWAASLTLGVGAGRDRWRTFVNRPTRRVGVKVFATMVPSDAVGVTLTPHESDDASRVQIALRYSDDVVRNVERARQRVVSLLAEAGRGADVSALDPLSPGASVHYGGGARMHHNPEFGVVDAWNRVHAVPNVVVADASCFPTGPEKNPTLTAMAIASRAGARLAADL